MILRIRRIGRHRGFPQALSLRFVGDLAHPHLPHHRQIAKLHGARVVGGPAKRRLAALPLHLVDGALMAAGGFKGRVGIKAR